MNKAEYARMFEAEERHWWYAGMRKLSFALLDPLLPGDVRPRILDAGCGTGVNLEHLGRRGRAVGVDLSADALEFCGSRGVAVARASVLALPFKDVSFDVATSFDVLYHRWVADDRAAVRELVRVLAPGGLLLIRVPALEMLRGAHDEAVHSRHRYTRGELVRLLRAEGLQVLRASYGNALLFPLLLLRRTLDRLLGREGSDVSFLPTPLEWLFGSLLALEARLLGLVPLPIGASVLALARKPRSLPR
jgi:SAM-dependent methyltransferase